MRASIIFIGSANMIVAGIFYQHESWVAVGVGLSWVGIAVLAKK